jgi:hypothetical protein
MGKGSKIILKEGKDRKLGDEWSDWDGTVASTDPVRRGIFVGVAFLAVVFLIAAAYLVVWLVQPRLISINPFLYQALFWMTVAFSAIVVLWLVFFSLSIMAGTSILGGLLMVPHPVNWLLAIALKIADLLGISRDRLVNSFLRVHNILIPFRKVYSPDELLVLLPRCLTRDTNAYMRSLRDKYRFNMATAGGGQEARKKIRELRPKAIVAIACERDLLSGFVEVNPEIPVVGVPNLRPEGPCKNTEVDREELVSLIRRLLVEP